jgi:FkbM family methyltransferase
MSALLNSTRRWTRSIRNGVSPVSLVRKKFLGDTALRFKGVNVEVVDSSTTWDLAFSIWGLGEYDQPGFAPQAGWKVVDIGGNVGLYAMYAAARGASVVSYEPHPDSARCQRANTARWNVECREAAVVGEPMESVRLWVNPERDIRHTLVAKDVRTGDELKQHIDVPAVTIDEALSEPVDLLKVDCEGGEFEIFAHGQRALRNVKRIIAEVHTNAGSPEQALADVRAAGFDASLQPQLSADMPYKMLTAARRG